MHSANLLDIAPTILTLFGLPVGGDMDGRPLVEAFTDRPTVQTISSWDDVPGRDGQHPEERKLDSDESREALEQLVALGYIERPAENQEKAVAQTVRELDYNLAMSYIDAGMHGRAAPILANLYRTYPLEFRFGIQLAMCLHTLGMTDDMSRLIDDLNTRWRKAAERARWRLAEVAEVAKQRRKEWREAKQEREEKGKQEGDDDAPSTPPQLFNEAEQRVVRSLRAIARGNEQTLDYLASSVAMSEKDYEKSLDHLQKARESETKTPGFHLQVARRHLRRRYGVRCEMEKHEGAFCFSGRHPCHRPDLYLPASLRHQGGRQGKLRAVGERGLRPRMGDEPGDQDSHRAASQHGGVS